MIILVTGVAQAKFDGERIRVNIESGEDGLDLSLSVHQATWLAVALADAINGALQPGEITTTADVLPFRNFRPCKPD